MATALANWFRQFGGDVYLEDVFPERPNVYAIWWGTSDKWRAIDVHTDTVGVIRIFLSGARRKRILGVILSPGTLSG